MIGEELSRRLEIIVETLGARLTAELLGVPMKAVRSQEIELNKLRVLVELDAVVTFSSRILHPKAFISWLAGNNAFLNGGKPSMVFVLKGSAPLLEALEAELAGVYA